MMYRYHGSKTLPCRTGSATQNLGLRDYPVHKVSQSTTQSGGTAESRLYLKYVLKLAQSMKFIQRRKSKADTTPGYHVIPQDKPLPDQITFLRLDKVQQDGPAVKVDCKLFHMKNNVMFKYELIRDVNAY